MAVWADLVAHREDLADSAVHTEDLVIIRHRHLIIIIIAIIITVEVIMCMSIIHHHQGAVHHLLHYLS